MMGSGGGGNGWVCFVPVVLLWAALPCPEDGSLAARVLGGASDVSEGPASASPGGAASGSASGSASSEWASSGRSSRRPFTPFGSGGLLQAQGLARASATREWLAWCSQLAADLEVEGVQRRAALKALRGYVPCLAFDSSGCRVVQRAFDVADQDTVASLAGELRGHIMAATKSAHANFVVQKLVQVLPLSLAHFVVEELAGSTVAVAQHQYGCRILCRVIEHYTRDELTDEQALALLGELVACAEELAYDVFGHHVAQAVIEYGPSRHRHAVAEVLLVDVAKAAKDRGAGHVVEKALTHCCAKDQQALASSLLTSRGRGGVASLARSPQGCACVRAALRLQGDAGREARGRVKGAAAQLATSKAGRRLLREADGSWGSI